VTRRERGIILVKVSVLIPTYNRENFLRLALESLVTQTSRDFEVIVYDNASTDGTKACVESFVDRLPLVRYVRQPVNVGYTANCIDCLNNAEGDYVKYLFDDDLLEPECIGVMATCLDDHPEVALVTSKRTRIDENGNPLPDIPATRGATAYDTLFTGRELIEEVLKQRLNFIGEPSTVMFRKNLLYEPFGTLAGNSFIVNSDIALWFQLLTRGQAIYLVKPLSCFRIHSGQGQLLQGVEIRGSLEWVILVREMRRLGYLQDSQLYQDVLNLNLFHLQRLLPGIPVGQEEWRTAFLKEICWIEEERVRATGKVASLEEKYPANNKVSIIIPTCNNLELTKQCIESIFRTLPASRVEAEIIVVDNASTDGTKDYLEGLGQQIHVVNNTSNLGFAKACNQGADIATGEYLLLLNNDTIVLGDWLVQILQPLQDESIGIVGCKLIYPNDTVQHAGVGFNDTQGWPEPVHVYRGYPRDAAEVTTAREVQAVTGACIVMKGKLYSACGMLDEGYINGLEDIDLCLKVTSSGFKIWYEPKAEVLHLESRTPGRFEYAWKNISRFRDTWEGKGIIDIDTQVSEGVYFWK